MVEGFGVWMHYLRIRLLVVQNDPAKDHCSMAKLKLIGEMQKQ